MSNTKFILGVYEDEDILLNAITTELTKLKDFLLWYFIIG